MIIEKINEVSRVSEGKFSSQDAKYIHDNTKFLSDVSFTERCYCVVHGITDIARCKVCNEPTKFVRRGSGYREYCSTKCANLYKMTPEVRRQISGSVKEYHTELPLSERRIQQNKRMKVLVDRGYMLDDSMKTDFYNYSRKVWRFTNESNIKDLPNYSLRGRAEVIGSYQLDHKYSIFQGFKDSILPYWIGSINNLEMIGSIDNIRKREKCSITMDELFQV